MLHDDITKFEVPLPDASELSAYARICGKSSRFLARSIVTKKLPMRNTAPLVSFTFDDAPASACSTGAFLLEQHQARGTFYISGAGCGRTGHCGRMATAAEVKAVWTNGHEIGCHTFSHTPVASVGRAALAAEVERNRAFLQAIHGDISACNFAYPYGQFSFGSKHYLQSRFHSCRTLRPGVNVGAADLGALKTCTLGNASIDREQVAGVIAETVRLNGWLIFASHDVEDVPSPYGVSPDLLVFALKTACEAGCRLVPVREALRILRGAIVSGA